MIELPQGRKSASMRSGRYALRLTPTLGYQVDVPDLWTVVSGRFLNAGPKSEGLFFVAPAPATTGLALHPCRDHTTRVVGPSVSDLAGALRTQSVLDVTKPVPVTLDGHRGLYLEVTIPAEVYAGSCVRGLRFAVRVRGAGRLRRLRGLRRSVVDPRGRRPTDDRHARVGHRLH